MKPNFASRLRAGLLVIAITLGLTTAAHAVSFDPDGAGSAPAINVGTFDWGPTSFLALGGSQAFANALGGCVSSCNFDVLTQARLVDTLAPNGAPNTPSGLNNSYEITMIARFTETITATTSTANRLTAEFATVTSAPAFLQIYFAPIPPNQAVDVSGSGFNDGRLILNGTTIGAANGSFGENKASFPLTAGGTTGPVNLDQNSSNDYNGQLTVTGSGNEDNVAIGGLTLDPTFFLQNINFGILFANISQGLPFISVDPADCYTLSAAAIAIGGSKGPTACDTAHTNGLMSVQTALAGGVVPNIGLVNGFGAFTGNPDFVAQTDFNSPVSAVPEPLSMLLVGIGLVGLSAYSRRKMTRK